MIRVGQEYYSFSSIELRPNSVLGSEAFSGEYFTTLKSVDFEHGRPIEGVYNFGQFYTGIMKGKYKASATIGMMLDEQQKFHLLLNDIYPESGIFDAGPFDIAMKLGKYGDGGVIIQHVIDFLGCYVLQDKFSSQSKDPFIDVQIPLYVREIVKDGIRPVAAMSNPTLKEFLRREFEEDVADRKRRTAERGHDQHQRRKEIHDRIKLPLVVRLKILKAAASLR